MSKNSAERMRERSAGKMGKYFFLLFDFQYLFQFLFLHNGIKNVFMYWLQKRKKKWNQIPTIVCSSSNLQEGRREKVCVCGEERVPKGRSNRGHAHFLSKQKGYDIMGWAEREESDIVMRWLM